MAKAENMLQTGHAGCLMWIKFRQMIHAVFLRGARFAAAAQQKSDAGIPANAQQYGA